MQNICYYKYAKIFNIINLYFIIMEHYTVNNRKLYIYFKRFKYRKI